MLLPICFKVKGSKIEKKLPRSICAFSCVIIVWGAVGPAGSIDRMSREERNSTHTNNNPNRTRDRKDAVPGFHPR